MRLLGTLFGVLVMTLGAGASWADGSIKDAPAPVEARCGGAFSGAYIGGQVGYLDHDAKFSDELGTDRFSGDDNGATGGVYYGYNIQCGRFVFGVRSDFNFGNSEASFFDSCCGQEISSDMKWFGTTRGRVGIAHYDNWLFYFTGGLAYADFDLKFRDDSNSFYQKNGETKFGYTVGGGVELLHVVSGRSRRKRSTWTWARKNRTTSSQVAEYRLLREARL